MLGKQIAAHAVFSSSLAKSLIVRSHCLMIYSYWRVSAEWPTEYAPRSRDKHSYLYSNRCQFELWMEHTNGRNNKSEPMEAITIVGTMEAWCERRRSAAGMTQLTAVGSHIFCPFASRKWNMLGPGWFGIRQNAQIDFCSFWKIINFCVDRMRYTMRPPYTQKILHNLFGLRKTVHLKMNRASAKSGCALCRISNEFSSVRMLCWRHQQ